MKKKLFTKEQLLSRIIARGEFSDHCHVITGEDVEVRRNDRGELLIDIGSSDAVLKHLIESRWMEGEEKWTEEHKDIDLSTRPGLVRHGDVCLKKVGDNTYQYIPQMVFDPLTKRIESARD